MTLALKWRLLDVGLVVLLLVLAAVPLIVLRGHPVWGRVECSAGMWALFAGTLALWAGLFRRAAPEQAADGRLAWWQTALVAVLLGGVAFVGVYLPIRIHFWGGADDFIHFLDTPLIPWMSHFDHGMNRPFTVLACAVGRSLTPGRIDGFLWLGAAVCWLNGLLLFAVLRELLPRARLLPVAAAVLLILDRSDPSRFYVLWISNVYWAGVALLLAGAWLFLWSHRRGSRLLLVPACAMLGGALLTCEGAYPVAVLVPALAWLRKEYRGRLPAWVCAWYGTLALLATRFLIFLSQQGDKAYQTRESGAVFRDPEALRHNLGVHLEAGLSNFQVTGAVAQHWKAAAALLVLVAALAALVRWRARAAAALPRRQYLVAVGLAGLALLLGIVPFLSMPYVFRTQYYAAPGLAVLLAGALCLAGSLLGRRLGPAAVVAALALLAANATAESFSEQHQRREQSPAHFERMAHVFRQIHAVYPNPAPDTLILLYADAGARPPFLCNYCCVVLGQRTLGASVVPVNFKDVTPLPVVAEFHADGVTVAYGKDVNFPGKAGYDRVVAFRLGADDTVTLMRWLPGHPTDGYQPLTLIQPGPVAEVPYLRYPRWMKRPRDLFDMKDGVTLGRGWGLLEDHEGEPARQFENGAELVVNPMGQRRRDLHLDVAAGRAGPLEILDADGRVVVSTALAGRQRVCLAVPTDPNRLNVVRLRLPGGPEACPVLRAYCPGGKGLGPSGAPRRPPLAADVAAGALSLGANWHPLETYAGLTFRWVPNDAELILEADQETAADLVVDAQVGPSLRGQPLRLELRDQAGKTLAVGADVQDRAQVRLPIPVGTRAGTVLRLHVEGGGGPAGNGDSRVLNFRVFRCAWRGA
jgi:hypothetical protein